VSETVGANDPERPPRPLETHRYQYNERGALSQLEGPDPTDDNRPLVAYRFHRDSLNRVTRLHNPDETEALVFYRPWERKVQDEDGSTKREVNDGFGRLIRVEEDERAGQTATTQYYYDVANRLKEVVNAGDMDDAARNPADPRRITRFKHDGQGNRIAIERPGGRRWSYEYDLDGNLFRRTDPDGRVVQYAHDFLGRTTDKTVIQSRLSNAETEALGIGRVHYDYDSVTAPNQIGQLTEVQFFAGSQSNPYTRIAYRYDAQGNVTSEAYRWNVGPTGDQQATMTHTYNALGAVSTAGYPNGVVATYSYDNRGLLKTVSAGGQTLASYFYNFARRIEERRSDFSQKHAYKYDKKGRLKSDTLNVGGRVVMQQDYEYSGNGDVTSIAVTDQLAAGPGGSGLTNWSYRFGYDGMHRLIHTDTGDARWLGAQYQADYGYAPSGNLASAKVEGPMGAHPRDVLYTYGNGTDTDPQAVTALQQRTSGQLMLRNTYDASGNLRQRNVANEDTAEFTYDVEDMVRRARKGGHAERYFYDHNHHRFLAINDDGSWRFYLGGEYELDISGRQREENDYVIGNGEAIARLGMVTASTGPSQQTKVLLHHNRRGDLLASFNQNGLPQSHFIYGASGEVLASTDVQSDWRRRFNGKEQDQIDGLSYYGYRYFDPLTLQWTSGDPMYRFAPDVALASPQRQNLYAFSLNNPLRYRDPNGLSLPGDDGHINSLSDSDFRMNPWSYKTQIFGRATVRLRAGVDVSKLSSGAVLGLLFAALENRGLVLQANPGVSNSADVGQTSQWPGIGDDPWADPVFCGPGGPTCGGEVPRAVKATEINRALSQTTVGGGNVVESSKSFELEHLILFAPSLPGGFSLPIPIGPTGGNLTQGVPMDLSFALHTHWNPRWYPTFSTTDIYHHFNLSAGSVPQGVVLPNGDVLVYDGAQNAIIFVGTFPSLGK